MHGHRSTRLQLIDLKAELYRKQEEFKQQKLKNKDSAYTRARPSEKKSDIWSKKNAGVFKRAEKDFEKTAEEENALEKSKKSLEAKAKLYEKIAHGSEIPEEDGSKTYLVDFQKKVIDKIVDDREKDREKKRKDEEEELRRQEEEILSKADIPPVNEEEEWVDYVDSFGRTRTCLRKDLKDLEGRNKTMIDNRSTKPYTPALSGDTPTLLSEDMRRELQRQKWEKEAHDNLNGPVHYSNIRFDEIRNHGTGFYEFSKTEETRQEQMETLGDLHKQTMEERTRRDRLKEKRKAMLDARLAKVKQRKRQKEGGGLFDTEADDDKADDTEDIGPKLNEISSEKVPEKPSEPALLTRDENINKNKPEREWDKGKERLFPSTSATSEEKYFQERRDERQSDFAPPTFYYNDNKPSPNRTSRVGSRQSDFAPPPSYFDKKPAVRHISSQPTNRKVYNEFAPPDKMNQETDLKINQYEGKCSENKDGSHFGTVSDRNIAEFLKTERSIESHWQQQKSVDENIEVKADVFPGTESAATDHSVESIPLPGEVTPPVSHIEYSTDLCGNTPSDRIPNDFPVTSLTNHPGGFMYYDPTPFPNLNVPPPPLPYISQYQPQPNTHTEVNWSNYPSDPSNVASSQTGFTQNIYSQKAEVSYEATQTVQMDQTTQFIIPKSSIVDTRLIRNEDALRSFEGDDADEPETEEKDSSMYGTESVDKNGQCDGPTVGQTVFSSAPVRYPQSTSYGKTEEKDA